MTGFGTTTFMHVDVISLLQLEKDLSKQELNKLSDTFTAELIYRLLDEKIPSFLTPEEQQQFRKEYKQYKTLEDVFNWFKKHKPDLDVELTIAQMISDIKKEFTYDYLLSLKQETEDVRKQQQIQTALNMINNREATPESITSVISSIY